MIIRILQILNGLKIASWLVCLLVLLNFSALAETIDSQATTETKNLFTNLKHLANQYTIYGQHHAYLLGETVDQSGHTSDSKSITGAHPGIVGFDFVRTTQWSATNNNSVFHRQVRALYERGGIATFSWHAKNPATGGSDKDVSGNPVQKILTPGSETQATFNAELDKIAAFFNSLKNENGTSIPVIWRPFHENSGSWFWWGAAHCSTTEYKALWTYVVQYLRDSHNVHNLLWAYSPSKPATTSDYLERYPGDNYVDVLGFDHYGDADAGRTFEKDILAEAIIVATLAEQRGKIAAITESGESKGFVNTQLTNWFSDVWLQLEIDPVAKNIAYIMTWNSPDWSTFKNGTNGHLYDDFIKFYQHPAILFESDLPELYQNADYSDLYYYVVNKQTGLRLKSCTTIDGSQIAVQNNTNIGNCAQWKLIEKSDYFHLENRHSGKYIRPAENKEASPIVLQPNTWTGDWTQWQYIGEINQFGYLINHQTGGYMKPENSNQGSAVTLTTNKNSWSQWQLIPVQP